MYGLYGAIAYTVFYITDSIVGHKGDWMDYKPSDLIKDWTMGIRSKETYDRIVYALNQEV